MTSDEFAFDVRAGGFISVSIHISECTQMNSAVLVTGPLSKGYYSYGSFEYEEKLAVNTTEQRPRITLDSYSKTSIEHVMPQAWQTSSFPMPSV